MTSRLLKVKNEIIREKIGYNFGKTGKQHVETVVCSM